MDASLPAGSTRSEVPRERLIGMLLASPARTVCLAGPSGYGKTTLVHQWADRDERPLVEVRRPGFMTEAGLVAEAIVAQLQLIGMVPADVTLPRAPDSLSWHLKVLPALGATLAGLRRAVLFVLDDATDLAGPAWEALADCIVDNLPRGSTVCILTRGEVPRAFRQQRLHGTELEIGADLLAFDVVETALLYRGLDVHLSDQQLHDLGDLVEGWPAVLYLFALALSQGRAVSLVSPELSVEIRDYMRDNILDRLDPETAEFLLTVSVLDELTGPMCTAVTGRQDAEAVLRDLADAYSLIRPLDAAGTRFRVHALLGSFLSDEFHTRSLQAWREAHLTASHAMAAAGDLDAAVRHAVLAGDDDEVVALIWPSATTLLASGRAPVLRRWLDAAGPERLARIPSLAVAAAWVAQQDGDAVAMGHYHALAARACERQECDDLRGHVSLIWASMAVDGVEDMEGTADAIVREFSPSDPARPTALYHRGAARVLLGRAEQGVDDLDAGRRLSEVLGLHVLHAILASELGIASFETGDSQRGISHLDEARSVLAEHFMDDLVVMAIPYASSAYGYALEGRTREARDHLKVAVRLVSRLRGPAPWFLVRSSLMLAEVALATGDPAQAKALLREAEHHYGRSSSCAFNDRLREHVRGALDDIEQTGAESEALTLAETRVMQYLPTHLSFPEIADELYLSRFTVKTQALAIYRKLGVHSRREAVERARTLGLIPPA